MNPELSAIFFGLASALCWGAGDFNGGFATKRNNVYSVVIVSQIVGIALLVSTALLLSEQFPASKDMFIGGTAGICGGLGLLALYRGLARGNMSIVAPVTAVVTAIIPVIFGMFIEGIPHILQLAGFGLAIIAVWFISQSDGETRVLWRDLSLPSAAGVGFGLFFILIDRVSDGAVLWPLVAARITSITMMFLFVTVTRHGEIPTAPQLPVIALAGIFDTGGNAFFALAAQAGRLDIAAVLSSLYPAGTIILARFILKERLGRQQWLGVIAALAAVVLIAL